MSESPARRLLLVSDGTGETVAQMTKAAMVQFKNHLVTPARFKNIRSESQIDAVLEDASIDQSLILHTLVSTQLRAYLIQKARDRGIPSVDLIGPLMAGLAQYLGYEPQVVAGLLHNVDERYFRRIEAVEFTISHDDGRDLTGLERADLVILGVSRTSKTPLSIYLSHQGWRVANIPLISGFEVPPEIQAVDQRKVIALTIDPEELSKIRRNRLERLGQSRGGDYADPDKVLNEIEYANQLFKRNRRWAVFNVTGKAVEETAAEIIKLMAARKLTPPGFDSLM